MFGRLNESLISEQDLIKCTTGIKMSCKANIEKLQLKQKHPSLLYSNLSQFHAHSRTH
jgi:hypothetical protein